MPLRVKDSRALDDDTQVNGSRFGVRGVTVLKTNIRAAARSQAETDNRPPPVRSVIDELDASTRQRSVADRT